MRSARRARSRARAPRPGCARNAAATCGSGSSRPGASRCVSLADREVHRALRDDHQLLAGMVHRRRAAVRVRLDRGFGARDQERPVAPGEVREVEPLLGRVDLRALVAADDADVRRCGLLDEVRHAAPERRRDLHQARDRRRHAALLDLVHRRRATCRRAARAGRATSRARPALRRASRPSPETLRSISGSEAGARSPAPLSGVDVTGGILASRLRRSWADARAPRARARGGVQPLAVICSLLHRARA